MPRRLEVYVDWLGIKAWLQEFGIKAWLQEFLAVFKQPIANLDPGTPDQPPSPKRLEWEYIQRTLLKNRGNISVTAKELGMHRRTLQHKLAKHPPGR